MNQQLLPSSDTKRIFRPIDLELCCDSYDEPTIAQQSRNKSIFRIPNDDDAVRSPPSVARANPIMDEEMRECENCNERTALSPYPYWSPSAEEIEERQHLMLGMEDWREPFEDDSPCQEEKKNDETTGKPMDFSCFFENVPTAMEDVDSDDDDVSFLYSDDEETILEEGGFVLEPVSPSIWDSVPPSPPSRYTKDIKRLLDSRYSPAQVSVASDSEEARSPSPLTLTK